jgi:hypothetical protein
MISLNFIFLDHRTEVAIVLGWIFERHFDLLCILYLRAISLFIELEFDLNN